MRSQSVLSMFECLFYQVGQSDWWHSLQCSPTSSTSVWSQFQDSYKAVTSIDLYFTSGFPLTFLTVLTLQYDV